MTPKTKFQVERIALFSDAVFAIAITLMIIEVKPPHLPHHASYYEAIGAVIKLVPMFAGVILSFVFIGTFWTRHHHLMKNMETYTPRLLFLNLVLLLTIVFIPFSTAFVFENVMSLSPVPLIFYNLNYIIASICNYRLYAYVLDPANNIMAPENAERLSEHRFELLYPIFVFSLVIILSFFSVMLAPVGYSAFGLEPVFKRKKVKAAGKA